MANNTIEVSHNGELCRLPAASTLQQALELWQYGDKKIAAAINGAFVPRSRYADTPLNHGDQIDLVSPVGGG